MKQLYQNPEEFAGEFMNNPRTRDEAIDGLIAGSSRFMLNIPWYGPARRISKLLRQGPFSDFYEFEMGLAQRLHPILARFNLNIVSEFLINNLFFKRYRLYSPDVSRILEVNPEPGPDAFEAIMTSMAEREGHYMAVKFCDLVVRNIDRALFRTLRSVELALVDMKKAMVDDKAGEGEHTERIAGELRDRSGDAAARIFLRRLKGASSPGRRFNPPGTAVVNDSIPSPAESSSLGGGEETTGKPRVHGREGRIHAYADVLRGSALDRIDGVDGERIRRLIDAIFRKNEKRFGAAEARAITLAVLRAWEGDESIEEPKRRLCAELMGEWSNDDQASGMAVDLNMAMSGESVAMEAGMEAPPAETAEKELEDEPFLIDEVREGGGSDEPEIAVDIDIDDSYLIDGEREMEMAGESEPETTEAYDPGHSFPPVEADDEALAPGVTADGDMADGEPERGATFVIRDEVLFEDSSLDAPGKDALVREEATQKESEPDPEAVEP